MYQVRLSTIIAVPYRAIPGQIPDGQFTLRSISTARYNTAWMRKEIAWCLKAAQTVMYRKWRVIVYSDSIKTLVYSANILSDAG